MEYLGRRFNRCSGIFGKGEEVLIGSRCSVMFGKEVLWGIGKRKRVK